jgi:hypothetical protein
VEVTALGTDTKYLSKGWRQIYSENSWMNKPEKFYMVVSVENNSER